MSKYNKEWEERIANSPLPNTADTILESIELGRTQIDMSGKLVDVVVTRLSNGNIEISPINGDEWLSEGTCTEGWNDEVIISPFVQ